MRAEAGDEARNGGGPPAWRDQPSRPGMVTGPIDPVGARLRALDLLAVLALTAGLLFLTRALIVMPATTVEFVLAMLLVQSAIPVLAVYLVVIRGRGLSWADLGFRRVSANWLLWGVAVAVLSMPLVALLNYLMQLALGEPFRNPQVDMVAPAGFSWRGLVGMLAVAGAIVPVVEEMVFRGLLHGWLRARVGVALAVALSSLLFAAAHGIVVLIPVLAAQGVLLAWLYERSGSLWPSVVMHGTFNAVMTVLLYAALAAGIAL